MTGSTPVLPNALSKAQNCSIFMPEKEEITLAEETNPKAEPGAETPKESVQTYTAEQLQAAVAERERELKTEFEQQQKLAGLEGSKRDEEEIRIARETLEREKEEFAHEKLVTHAKAELAAAGLPAELAPRLAGTDEQSTTAAVKALKKTFDAAVETAVSDRLRGKTPGLAPESGKAAERTVDIIRKNQRRR